MDDWNHAMEKSKRLIGIQLIKENLIPPVNKLNNTKFKEQMNRF